MRVGDASREFEPFTFSPLCFSRNNKHHHKILKVSARVRLSIDLYTDSLSDSIDAINYTAQQLLQRNSFHVS